MAASDLAAITLPETAVLAPPHRISVSVEGATELLGRRWAQLVEQWSADLPPVALPTVADYAASLCRWVEGRDDLRSARHNRHALTCTVRDEFLSLRSELLDACDAAGITHTRHTTWAAADVVESVLAARLHVLRGMPACARLGDLRPADIDGFTDVVAAAADWAFDDTPRTAAGDALLAEIAAALLVATEGFASDTSLTFVGSGADSPRPVSRTITVAGFVGGRLKAWPAVRQEVAVPVKRQHWLEAAHARLDEALGDLDDVASLHCALEDAHRVLWRQRMAAA